MPGAILFRSVGLVIVWLGFALRVWAITTLGAAFRTTVEVDQSQPVVTKGPYRWVRHPSYTGLWLEMIGVGLSTGNAASTATCTLMPLIGITARINGEERELTASLPGYREYIQDKPRLVPHFW